eukprot:1006049-Prymnesium_polylepis.1
MQHKHAWRTYVRFWVWAPSHAHAFAHGRKWMLRIGVELGRCFGDRIGGRSWTGAPAVMCRRTRPNFRNMLR